MALVGADDDVNDAIDGAYRSKYGRYSSYLPPMLAPQARATTLKLISRDRENRS